MARRVVLHVGLMKSGTSYLQMQLHANQDLLAARGVLFPGETWRDQVLAVGDVLGRKQVGPSATGRWASLVEEIARYDGDVVVSMEFLGPARPERIAAVVGAFGQTPVEVVVTLRDLGRGVPSMWQESLQNGGSFRFAEYVAALPGKRKPARTFWRQQGMARIVDNWCAAVGPERVTLVTVPPPGGGSDELWSRFCEAAAIDGAGATDAPLANTSLDAASAMALRELNARLDGGLSAGDYRDLVKFGLAKRVLAGRGGPAIGFVPMPWLVERSEQIVDRLAASGARVVGDLAELAPVEVPGIDPDDVPDADVLSAAVAALSASTLRRAQRASPAR
jgi:hypothetical protein